jgi:hypothetical protein
MVTIWYVRKQYVTKQNTVTNGTWFKRVRYQTRPFKKRYILINGTLLQYGTLLKNVTLQNSTFRNSTVSLWIGWALSLT